VKRAIKRILKALTPRCIFHCDPTQDPVAGLYWFERGCVCFRNRRIMPLCKQHVIKAEPLAGMRPIVEF
jgi:hypothetical protein